ncbi:Wzz/FepE/Etk N-terminal domain-containing protein [Algoriphagus namhaensis]
MEIKDLIETIKKNSKQLLLLIFGFVIFGVFIVFLTPKTYRAESLLLPEPKGNSAMSAGGLSSLASSIPGFSGLSLSGAGSDAIRPEFYPAITQSTPFITSFRDYSFFHQEYGEELSIITYGEKYAPFDPWAFLKKYTLGLPGVILQAFRSEDRTAAGSDPANEDAKFYSPTAGEFKFLKTLRELVNVSVDKKTGIIRIAVETTNPLLSAELAEFTKNYLVNFVQQYRSEKQQQIVDFLAAKEEELREVYLSDQAKLASFKERNVTISSPYLLNQQENLAAQYELSKSMYFSINSQLEQAKVKLNEVTPIFVEIEPVTVPALKSKPQTLLILFLMASLGILAAAILVLIKTPTRS